MALIKDNHIAASKSIATAIGSVRYSHPGVPIEVEVTSLEQLRQVLCTPVERVMLDNMSYEQMKEAIELVRSAEAGPEIEISGGVALGQLERIARLEPDYVSVGALTHSAPALDLSLELSDPGVPPAVPGSDPGTADATR
jgi:nicotinate-nucleotide pyrophosphorylase (carboxylating)